MPTKRKVDVKTALRPLSWVPWHKQMPVWRPAPQAMQARAGGIPTAATPCYVRPNPVHHTLSSHIASSWHWKADLVKDSTQLFLLHLGADALKMKNDHFCWSLWGGGGGSPAAQCVRHQQAGIRPKAWKILQHAAQQHQ
mmetsp:Transcript_82303/g.137627  ORF Transcript_82303/g.137627 Transcript_82303/m.137627 type:complete len:139 (+) Transcript_82303:196-612(+)